MFEPPEADSSNNSESYMDYVQDDLYQEVSDYGSARDVGCISTLLMFAIGGAGLVYTLAVIFT
jgi:hypothetical protein|tara:strand:+ start:907 stop:1095 length:189 start_codon:yes stop_codon:yes gene_type:complete